MEQLVLCYVSLYQPARPQHEGQGSGGETLPADQVNADPAQTCLLKHAGAGELSSLTAQTARWSFLLAERNGSCSTEFTVERKNMFEVSDASDRPNITLL